MSTDGSKGQTEQLLQALCESQRLDLIGQVTGSIAHDINNALSVVSGTTELLLEKLSEEVSGSEGSEESAEFIGEVRREVQTILNWSDSTIRAAHRLLEFSHRLRTEEDDVDLNTVVSEATELIRDRCEREEILLLCDADRTIPRAVGKSGQLLQVVLNVIQNAREALGSRGGELGGSIRVATSTQNDRIRVEVEDSGPGIGDDSVGKLFEPTFTTKVGSASAGLGLAVSRMIARQHGGDLTAEPCDSGARFVLDLPPRVADSPDS